MWVYSLRFPQKCGTSHEIALLSFELRSRHTCAKLRVR